MNWSHTVSLISFNPATNYCHCNAIIIMNYYIQEHNLTSMFTLTNVQIAGCRCLLVLSYQTISGFAKVLLVHSCLCLQFSWTSYNNYLVTGFGNLLNLNNNNSRPLALHYINLVHPQVLALCVRLYIIIIEFIYSPFLLKWIHNVKRQLEFVCQCDCTF